MLSKQRTLQTFWWRPLTGTIRQRALDTYYFRPRLHSIGDRIHWGLRNFGDELTPLVFEGLEPSLKVQHVDCGKASAIGIGTVLERALQTSPAGTTVLGAGLGSPLVSGWLIQRARRLNIQLVRGALTAKLLGSDLPQGDPALALSVINWAPRGGRQPPDTSERPITLILHFRAERSKCLGAQISRLASQVPAQVLSSADPVALVLSTVSTSEIVVTTTLHGLIVADAFGIPAVPATEYSTDLRDFRFDDYHSAVGMEQRPLVPVSALTREIIIELAWDRHRRLGTAALEKGAEVAGLMSRVLREL